MSVLQRTLYRIKQRRANIAAGNVNSIPIPLRRLSIRGFPGIEKETYYLITAQTKGAKSQFTSFLFLFTPILYALNNDTPIKIFYVPLEETPERVMCRFISFMMYSLYGKYVSYRDLMSSNNYALSKEILDLLESDEMLHYLNKFEEIVEFIEEDSNPTGIYKIVKEYCEHAGTTYTKEIETKDEFGQKVKKRVFSSYAPKDPNQLTLVIVDHISLLSQERGFTLKQTIDKMSDYFVELRNRYGISPVVIQQQNDNEQNDSFKVDNTEPNLTNLRDTKNPGKDCNIAISIYSPFQYKKSVYKGYDISILKDNFRAIKVLASRDGESQVIIGVRFDGRIANFSELPYPQDPEMQNIYTEIQNSRTQASN